MFSLLWQVNIWCFPSSLFTLYLHFLRSSLVIYFPFSPSFLFPLSCLLFLSPFCPSCSKVLLSKDRTRCRWWRQIIEDIIKRLTRRSVRFTHHIWNIKKKKNCMQTGLTVRQALIFIHRQTQTLSRRGLTLYSRVKYLSCFIWMSEYTYTRTHSLPVCFKHQWRTLPTCSSSSLTNLNVVCSPVGPQSFCEELCVCGVFLSVCVCNQERSLIPSGMCFRECLSKGSSRGWKLTEKLGLSSSCWCQTTFH